MYVHVHTVVVVNLGTVVSKLNFLNEHTLRIKGYWC